MAKVLIGNVKGPQGDAATVSVGTVSTGAAGSSAAVTNSGTSSEAVFNFTIPKGDAGTPGVTDFATSSTAGLVRIGSDFNINAQNGTLSENNTFTEAASLSEINSGDAHATILGKIKKFMNTLMPSTFVKDNVTSSDTQKALSAKQGKVLASNFATVESSTASKAYSAGDYMVFNGILYKVVSSISSGSTISVSSLEQVDVGSSINRIDQFASDMYNEVETVLYNTDFSDCSSLVEAGTSVTITRLLCYQFGRLVMVSGVIETSASLASSAALLTGLPNADSLTDIVLIYNEKAYRGNVRTTGEVHFGATTAAGTFSFNFVYAAASV